MLKVCEKGDHLSVIPLTPDDDRAMRMAFGRFATAEARATGAEVVQRFQHKGAGYWFACDCLDGLDERPPVLIPVSYTHLFRTGARGKCRSLDGTQQRDPAPFGFALQDLDRFRPKTTAVSYTHLIPTLPSQRRGGGTGGKGARLRAGAERRTLAAGSPSMAAPLSLKYFKPSLFL